jgi:hypothetical protein
MRHGRDNDVVRRRYPVILLPLLVVWGAQSGAEEGPVFEGTEVLIPANECM